MQKKKVSNLLMPGEDCQVILILFDQPKPVCSNTHSERYSTFLEEFQTSIQGTLYFALNSVGVGAYLQSGTLVRRLSQKEISACEKELLRWVKTLQSDHLLEGCPEELEECLLGREDVQEFLNIKHERLE